MVPSDLLVRPMLTLYFRERLQYFSFFFNIVSYKLYGQRINLEGLTVVAGSGLQ
jgi:hypothetical protein